MVSAQKITSADAAAHLSAFDLVDPEGSATVASVCATGQCFALDFDSGRLVYVVQLIGSALWITAAAGHTQAAARATLAFIESQARTAGARLVKFQTVRHGLVRLARRSGYVQSGYVLSKVVA
jgi:hypothetical protein